MIKERIKLYDGNPIAMPGIYARMPMVKYHAADAAIEPSISSSGLRTIFTQSPKHYWATSPFNPKRVEDDEESDALRFGRAAHHLLFGEEEFKKFFAIAPTELGGEPFSLRRKVCKLWREAREAEGKSFLRREEMDQILGMRDSLADHSLVKAGILNGLIETSWFTKHKGTGVWLKARPDTAPTASLDFADLKTTVAIDRRSLQYAIYDYGYFIQAGLVAMIVKDVLGEPLHSFSFVFIEKKPPHDIAVAVLKGNEIDRGINAAEWAINRFAECYKAKKWPGRYENDEAQYIEMTEWQQNSIDERLTTGLTCSIPSK